MPTKLTKVELHQQLVAANADNLTLRTKISEQEAVIAALRAQINAPRTVNEELYPLRDKLGRPYRAGTFNGMPTRIYPPRG